MCSWKFPQTQNRKLMLGLKLFVEFVAAHRKLRKILWPPSVLLENRHKNKEKSKASTSNTYNQRGNHRDDAGPALSLYILFIFWSFWVKNISTSPTPSSGYSKWGTENCNLGATTCKAGNFLIKLVTTFMLKFMSLLAVWDAEVDFCCPPFSLALPQGRLCLLIFL